MDYEKKYKDALADMKVIYPNLKGDAKKAIEHAFPELNESEDERMINFLYCELTTLCAKECNEGGNGSDRYNTLVVAMDWLEKQKEQRPVEWSAYDKATIEYIIEDIKELRDEETNEEAIETYNRELNLLQCINDSIKLCNYTNSAEWSEEDDALLKEIVSFLKDGTVKLQHDLDLYAGFLEKKFKSLRPQLKREAWTEEDSLAIKEIQNALEIYMINHGISEKQRKKLARWLDIHCNSYPLPAKLYPHWKPSEEQMKALEEVRTIFHHHHLWDEINPILYDYEELMRDLQKLL